MRYILITLLVFVSVLAHGQIRAKQIRVDSQFARLQFLVNDTVSGSPTYRLGRWMDGDSLGALGDRDWLKYNGSLIPTNTDSAYRIGVTEVRDTAGVDQTIFINGEGLSYRGAEGAGGRSLLLAQPLQTTEGNTNFSLSIGAFDVDGVRDNDVAFFGWNAANGGVPETSGEAMIGISLENHYSVGSKFYNEFHVLHTDTAGTARRPLTMLLDKGNTSTWIGAFHMPTFEFRNASPSSNYYARFQLDQAGARSLLSLFDPAVGKGASFIMDQDENYLQVTHTGLTNPIIYLNPFWGTQNARLNFGTSEGSPATIVGRASNGWLNAVELGFGLVFSNDTLFVDTTQVGGGGGSGGSNLTIEGSGPTYTIASSSGTDVHVTEGQFIDLTELAPDTLRIAVDTNGLIGVLADADFFKQGTTTPPAAIGDTMYHTGLTAIGESTSSVMYGNLTVGPDGPSDVAISVVGYPDSTTPFMGVYPQSDDDNGWEFLTEDDFSLYFRRVDAGVPSLPFGIEGTPPTGALLVLSDGDVYIGEYPNTRDDGTASNFLGTNASGQIQSYDINDVVVSWLLAATGTGGTEEITDGETVTFAASGPVTATRVGSTITYTVTEADGSTVNEAWTIDATGGDTELISNQTVLFQGAGINTTSYNAAANTLTITGTEADGSNTNELNRIEEGNVLVQADNVTVDFQTLFDVAADGAGEVNVSLDLSEATSVTTPETDDWVIMHDAGLSQHQKILYTDLVSDIITFKESNTGVGTGTNIDFGTGFDVSMSPSTEANITLDFSEFTTDAAPEGDEFVILSDGAGTQEKVAITYFSTGGDTNFAEDNLTFTGNRTHDMDIYSVTLTGPVMNWTFLDENGGSGNTIILASELGVSTGITGGINFQSRNGGTPTEQYDIEAEKYSSSKQALRIAANQDTDAHIILEKNSNLSGNTTQSHLAINGGVAYTQNYEWTGTGSDLTIDRGYYIINVSGSGALGDEINLPEITSSNDNWNTSAADGACQVGQEYVITNFRAATNLVVRQATGDQIDLGGTDPLTIPFGESRIIKAVRLSGSTGYWFSYD